MEKRVVGATLPAKKDAQGNFIKGREVDKYAEVSVGFGETAAESIQMFGDSPVNSNAWSNGKITVQAGIRRGLLAGKTQEQLQAEYDNWKLGEAVEAAKIDPIQASLARFKTMNKEERNAYLKALKDAAAEA